uniref:Uncharacterized protein n=1 Tax=Oncorhynchus kisutch TaxID=8019 RepID=A0A8C7FLM5_ONCKI
MIPPADSLLKYDNPVLVNGYSSNLNEYCKFRHSLKVAPQQPAMTGPILNAILPPRYDMTRNVWRPTSCGCSKQARETGICPVLRELYSQCFDRLTSRRPRLRPLRRGRQRRQVEKKHRGDLVPEENQPGAQGKGAQSQSLCSLANSYGHCCAK